MGKVAIVRDPLCLLHSNGPGHPESPERLRAIDAMLAGSALKDALVELPGRDASREQVARVHEDSYIRQVEATRSRAFTQLEADTAANRHSCAAAFRAAGCVIAATEAVLGRDVPGPAGGMEAAFAFVRPPGHHAESGAAMGFCFFNNVAVAAADAIQRLGLSRVLIVDWDVHHGNGTMHSFYESDQVLFFSLHRFPWYPGTGRVQEIGAGTGKGFTVNVPLPEGQGDDDYAAVFRRVLEPVALQFRPELILVSAGFDIAAGDPLGGMLVSPDGFARLAGILRDLCRTCCPGRLVFTLEGGYDLRALASGVEAVLEALSGKRPSAGAGASDKAEPGPETRAVIEAARDTLLPYWSALS